VIFALAASLVFSQAGEPPPPQVTQAGDAFAGCVSDRLVQAEDRVRPERIADAILDRCRPQQDAMTASHARWVQASNLSEREKAQSLRAAQRNLRAMRGQIIETIRRDRQNR